MARARREGHRAREGPGERRAPKARGRTKEGLSADPGPDGSAGRSYPHRNLGATAMVSPLTQLDGRDSVGLPLLACLVQHRQGRASAPSSDPLRRPCAPVRPTPPPAPSLGDPRCLLAVVRDRYSFANPDEGLVLPDLIAIQRESFRVVPGWGLADTFRDISPIDQGLHRDAAARAGVRSRRRGPAPAAEVLGGGVQREGHDLLGPIFVRPAS